MAYNPLRSMKLNWQKTLRFNKTKPALSGAGGNKKKIKNRTKKRFFACKLRGGTRERKS